MNDTKSNPPLLEQDKIDEIIAILVQHGYSDVYYKDGSIHGTNTRTNRQGSVSEKEMLMLLMLTGKLKKT